MGSQDEIEERLALDLDGGERGVARQQGADERVAVGVQAVRGDGDDLVAVGDPRAVDDLFALDNPDRVGDEDIGPRIEDARLLGSLAAGEAAPWARQASASPATSRLTIGPSRWPQMIASCTESGCAPITMMSLTR
jgi:hypothetical protein